MSERSQTFEASMQRLEEIVRQLFQEGTALVKSCTALLDSAEQQIVKLMKTADGTPAETEFVRDE